MDDFVRSPDIQAIVDRDTVRQILLRYFRGVDRWDRELIASAFHPDAVIRMGPDRVLSGSDGPDEMLSAMAGMPIVSQMHLVGNMLIDVVSDVAATETYAVSIMVLANMPDGRVMRVRGRRYIDRFERRRGEWGIVERFVTVEWARFDDVDDASFTVDEWSRRDTGDVSYRVMPGVAAKPES